MSALLDACTAVWNRLNPREPGLGYLVTFFATAMALFFVAFLIGQA